MKMECRWFSEYPTLKSLFKLTSYRYSCYVGRAIGFHRTPKFTILQDLNHSPEELLKQCKSNTRNEIRRASREDVQFETGMDHHNFIEFFNRFAQSRNVSKIEMRYLEDINEHFLVTTAMKDEKILAVHGYFMDRQIQRVRLLFSAIETSDNVDNKLVGWANRFLHHEDMLYFKKDSFSTYDFGGYSNSKTDRKLMGIDKFKASFGGEIIEESNYTPLPWVLLRKIKQKILFR